MKFLRSLPVLLLVAMAVAALPARAEEFYMKDGSKVVGKIVAYEKDSFRVETSFGIEIGRAHV